MRAPTGNTCLHGMWASLPAEETEVRLELRKKPGGRLLGSACIEDGIVVVYGGLRTFDGWTAGARNTGGESRSLVTRYVQRRDLYFLGDRTPPSGPEHENQQGDSDAKDGENDH